MKRATRTKTSTRTRRSSTPGAHPKKKITDRTPGASIAYLGLGSNLGNRRARLESALREIARLAPVRKVSSFYRSEPVGFRDQPDFWNAVVEITWSGTARGLLEAARQVERRVGRTPSFRNGPREIDVDVLDFGGRIRSRDPILPHPRLNERRFALAPLGEVNPRWRDPRSGRTVRELLASLPASPRIAKIALRARRPGE
ncbi:MAG TPA: 2-amino-4-hydroxy-6-hydroxymethyldihydropteridine diphosphokinase [Thermoanaerobaculia bacterium]|nr:2-amino-4-hydroxy-6-hydroxymethyldihydropteridine diphosphokinase [Thermoanaerobaculia bacterium]